MVKWKSRWFDRFLDEQKWKNHSIKKSSFKFWFYKWGQSDAWIFLNPVDVVEKCRFEKNTVKGRNTEHLILHHEIVYNSKSFSKFFLNFSENIIEICSRRCITKLENQFFENFTGNRLSFLSSNWARCPIAIKAIPKSRFRYSHSNNFA